jgi:hypothetical protein
LGFGLRISEILSTDDRSFGIGTEVDVAVEKAAKSLGERAGKTVTPGQVLLKWAAAKGDISVTTSGKVGLFSCSFGPFM